LKVWDLPTRLFHWLIGLLVGFSWWSAETGEMEWHYRSGLTALILLVFRIVWGFVGGSTARFGQFVRSPAAVIGYVRGPAAPAKAGHNPLGGYSVIALLLALTIQVGTGLFAVDTDGLESGPLSYLVSFDQGRLAAEVHHLAFSVVQGLVLLHVLAIGWYRLRGRRLIGPMITGRDRQLPAGSGEVTGGGALRAIVVLAIALGIGWWVSLGAPLGGAG
jgi:cytochrome b